jgi:hypothetical protein
MSENQSEQPATPVGSVQHPTLVGYVQHLQVEDTPSWPVMVCRIKVESSGAIENFFLRLIDNQPIFEAQLNLLRDAIVHDKIRVRIMYDPKNKLGPNASRIVAVRLQLYPE